MESHDQLCRSYGTFPHVTLDGQPFPCDCELIAQVEQRERELGEAIARGMVEQAVREERLRMSKEGWVAPEAHEAVRATTRVRAELGTRRDLQTAVLDAIAKCDEVLHAPRATGKDYLEALGASRALNILLVEIGEEVG